MINRIYTLFVCMWVFIPMGADIAVVIDYDRDPSSIWVHLVLFIAAAYVVMTDGIKAPIEGNTND